MKCQNLAKFPFMTEIHQSRLRLFHTDIFNFISSNPDSNPIFVLLLSWT